MKKKKVRKLIFIIVDIFVLLLALYFILGYVNFIRVSKNQEPYLIFDDHSYEEKDAIVHVWHGGIYKIVRHEIPNKSITMRLKLWFMKDV